MEQRSYYTGALQLFVTQVRYKITDLKINLEYVTPILTITIMTTTKVRRFMRIQL